MIAPSNQTWRDRLPKDRLEESFEDFKQPLSPVEAADESSRCLNCYDAPCINACPTSINIPQFISRIASNNTSGAAKTILEANPLGLSCAQACPTEVLCEGACVYNNLNHKPIMIGKLQRFAVEDAYERGLQFFTPGAPTGKRVALIGAGPASLACAHELRKNGHEAVIFEKELIPGGLNTHGIAPYKMKAQTSLLEIEQISKMGVRFEYDQELGRNLFLNSLLAEYDAVFLGMGLGADSRLDVPGAQLPEVRGAVEFIAEMKTQSAHRLAELRAMPAALVVGGGNTALDACRELKKLFVPRVIVSYRRIERDMSGYAHEFKWARQEGVEFLFNTVPVGFEEIPGKAHSILANLNLTETTADGKVQVVRQNPIQLEVGLVLMATGQSKLQMLLSDVRELQFDRGVLKVDEKTGRTGHPKIFAGGDLSNGGKEVVNAVAEGKRAALAIHEGLTHG